ncbi:MAG TPA: ACP S-malonyltransferase [Phycisphaerales bacterium]|nr:ACP S-malonyltransferase [Phycisphaerales bacterium]
MTSRIILCPGQGAQFVGMGRAWFDQSPEAKAVFERADRHLGDRLGAPLSKLCFEGPADRLNRTDVSQPAIYATSIACSHALLAAWGAGKSAPEAGIIATGGLSLGEYTALHLAGSFSFEDGLELVVLRARAMQDAADAIQLPDKSPGSGMVALIGADEAQATDLCTRATGRGPERSAPDVLVCANFNCPGQIVISGSIAACTRAVEIAASMGLRAQPLPVAGAFHSPLMAPAAERLAAALQKTPITAPRCPVMSNVTGQAHSPIPGRTIEDSIRTRLVEQLTSPVRWEQDCRSLLAISSGGVAGAGTQWHELAPGRGLMGMMRRIEKATKVETHDEP